MATSAAVAEVLGIERRDHQPMSLLSLVAEVEQGLPLSALDRLVRQVAPSDNAFIFRLVPRATLARRRQDAAKLAGMSRLSPDEGAKVARLADIWAFAREVWGSDDEAREFLFRPHPMLDGRLPVDVVLASEFGRPLVEGILGGLRYGSAV